MERFDVSEGDRLADMVARAEAGEAVEITRDGRVVAELRVQAKPVARSTPLDLAALERMRASLKLWKDDPVALVRELRDGPDW